MDENKLIRIIAIIVLPLLLPIIIELHNVILYFLLIIIIIPFLVVGIIKILFAFSLIIGLVSWKQNNKRYNRIHSNNNELCQLKEQ